VSDARIIKKYPNRRLYDTVESRYITLSDIRSLVTQQVPFVVIDKRSGEEITRTILLQVIAEQEHSDHPMMSQDFLSQLIRAYGGAMQHLAGDYLEQSLKLFSAQQSQIRDRMRSMVGLDPVTAVANLAQEHFDRFSQRQASGLNTALTDQNRAHPSRPGPSEPNKDA